MEEASYNSVFLQACKRKLIKWTVGEKHFVHVLLTRNRKTQLEMYIYNEVASVALADNVASHEGENKAFHLLLCLRSYKIWHNEII